VLCGEECAIAFGAYIRYFGPRSGHAPCRASAASVRAMASNLWMRASFSFNGRVSNRSRGLCPHGEPIDSNAGRINQQTPDSVRIKDNEVVHNRDLTDATQAEQLIDKGMENRPVPGSGAASEVGAETIARRRSGSHCHDSSGQLRLVPEAMALARSWPWPSRYTSERRASTERACLPGTAANAGESALNCHDRRGLMAVL
jgi:hypothetical protein